MLTTDPLPAQDKSSLLFLQLLSSLARHGMTVAAGWLVSQGLLPSAQSNEAVDLFTGILLAGLALAWSYVEKKLAKPDATPAVEEKAEAAPAPSSDQPPSPPLPPQIGLILLAALLAFGGCYTLTATQKAQWSATGQLATQKLTSLITATILDAAVSQADAGNKADLLDSLSQAFWTQPIVTSADVQKVTDIWLPDKAHWQALGTDLAAAKTNGATPAEIATALTDAAALVRQN